MWKIIALALAVTIGLAGSAWADELWVVNNGTNDVWKIDVDSQTAVRVGATGVNVGFGGLGFHSDGTLYGWTTAGNGTLYTVNQATGAWTFVGNGSFGGADTFDIQPGTDTAIAWSVTGEIRDVNLATGATSFRVNTAPSNTGIASAFAADGTLYQTAFGSPLTSVNIDTGAVTTIGGGGVQGSPTNLGWNPVDGMLYQVGLSDARLWRIDPLNGSVVNLGVIAGLATGGQITMGTFNAGAAVPEPGSIALLGLGLVGLGFASRRRKAKAS